MSERRGLLMVVGKCLLLVTQKMARSALANARAPNLDQTASDTAERYPSARVPGRADVKARGDSLLPARQGRR